MTLSRPLLGATLAALGLLGCIPPPMPSSSELTARQLEYNQKQSAKATDPEIKKFWDYATECLKKHGMVMGDGDPASKTPYVTCTHERETEHIAVLEERAANEKDPSERDHDLKVVSCIDRIKRTAGVAPYSSIEDCVARTEARAQDSEALATKSDWAEAEKAATPKAWIAFLGKHPKDKRASEVMKRVLDASASAEPNEQASLDEELVKAYPAAIRDVPPERRLLMVGPPGIRVRDVKKMADAKIAPSIVVARIRAASQPYKNFDGDELTLLKKMGISDDAVTAMIEVSSKLEDKQKADEERKALRAELDALRKLIEEKKASGGGQASGKTVQTKDGPMDVLESCAKRLAAMKLCEQLPFPGSTICTSTTDSEFPCPEK